MQKFSQSQSGAALLYVVIMLGFVFVIAYGVSTVSLRESRTVAFAGSSLQAYYAAEAAVERGLYTIFTANDDQVTRVNEECFTGSTNLRCDVALVPANDDGVPSNTIQRSLKEQQSQTLTIFDPLNLATNYITGPGQSMQVRSNVANSDAWVEVSVIYFNRNNLGGFTLEELLADAIDLSSANVDSGIVIDRFLCNETALDPATGNCGYAFADPATNPNRRYLIQLKPLRDDATLTVTLPENAAVGAADQELQAFGTDQDRGLRRGIAVQFDRQERPLQIFNYVLYSDEPIRKNAPQPLVQE